MTNKTLWTTRQLAEEATRRGRPITQERVRQLCAAGAIRGERPSRDWVIADAEARRWLERYIGKE